MATVTTTTQADPLAMPSNAPIGRDASNGNLFVIVRTGASTLTVYRSTDSGGSWASYAAFTHTNLGSVAEWSSFIVDKNGWAHLAYRVSDTSSDTIWYRRVSTSAASPTWSGGLQLSETDGNGGSPGSVWQGVDMAVVRNPDASYSIAVVGCRTQSSYPRYGIQIMGVTITPGGAVSRKNGLVAGTREYWIHGVTPGRFGVSCETEHNGTGDTSANVPNLWVSWGRIDIAMVKLIWSQSTLGWTGPSTGVFLKLSAAAQDDRPARWDGVRWITASIDPNDLTEVEVRERNQANTKTTLLPAPPAHPAGNVRNIALSYDYTTKNLRVFATGTSTTHLYFVDYVRQTATWGAWAQVSPTAVLGTGGVEFGVRHGGTFGNARHDVVTAHAGSPNTVAHTGQTGSSTPNTPQWVTSTQPYTHGGAADVGAALTLDWSFSDPDPGDTQSSWALSRQIGAGTVQYWRSSDSTWQATEQQNAGSSTQVTFAAGWAAGTDAAYTWKVRVWDSANTPSADYSNGLTLIPSTKVDPAITSPTPGGVVNTERVTVTWTATEQTQRRVRLLTSGGTQRHDSGFQADTTKTYTVPYTLDNGTAWQVEVTTKNNEGLTSNADTHSFTVSYAPPPPPTPTFTVNAAKGWITVAAAAAAPVGAQPAITSLALYRRIRTTLNMAANPAMDGGIGGWSTQGGSSAYSTAQFRSAPGSALITPNGSNLDSLLFSDLKPDVSALIAAGSLFYAGGWIRPTTGNKSLRVRVPFYDAAGTFIAATVATYPAPVAGAWVYIDVVGNPADAPGAARVGLSIGLTGTAAITDTAHVDELWFGVYDPDTGVPVAAAVSPAGSVDDWGVAGDLPYQYRWTAAGANGTAVTGPWTE